MNRTWIDATGNRTRLKDRERLCPNSRSGSTSLAGFRERRERDSRGREHQLGHGIGAQTANANGSILAEGNQHHRTFSSAADGAVPVPAAGPVAADQSLESETDLHRDEQDRQRHCRQQARKVRRDLERDEEHVNQGFHWRKHPQPAETLE